MIPRPRAIERIERALTLNPIATLLGPRHCGKTTLARMIAEREPSTFFDLENPVDSRRLSAPMKALEGLSGLVIIDEVHQDLSLEHLWVIYPGDQEYHLHDKISVIPISAVRRAVIGLQTA